MSWSNPVQTSVPKSKTGIGPDNFDIGPSTPIRSSSMPFTDFPILIYSTADCCI